MVAMTEYHDKGTLSGYPNRLALALRLRTNDVFRLATTQPDNERDRDDHGHRTPDFAVLEHGQGAFPGRSHDGRHSLTSGATAAELMLMPAALTIAGDTWPVVVG